MAAYAALQTVNTQRWMLHSYVHALVMLELAASKRTPAGACRWAAATMAAVLRGAAAEAAATAAAATAAAAAAEAAAAAAAAAAGASRGGRRASAPSMAVPTGTGTAPPAAASTTQEVAIAVAGARLGSAGSFTGSASAALAELRAGPGARDGLASLLAGSRGSSRGGTPATGGGAGGGRVSLAYDVLPWNSDLFQDAAGSHGGSDSDGESAAAGGGIGAAAAAAAAAPLSSRLPSPAPDAADAGDAGIGVTDASPKSPPPPTTTTATATGMTSPSNDARVRAAATFTAAFHAIDAELRGDGGGDSDATTRRASTGSATGAGSSNPWGRTLTCATAAPAELHLVLHDPIPAWEDAVATSPPVAARAPREALRAIFDAGTASSSMRSFLPSTFLDVAATTTGGAGGSPGGPRGPSPRPSGPALATTAELLTGDVAGASSGTSAGTNLKPLAAYYHDMLTALPHNSVLAEAAAPLASIAARLDAALGMAPPPSTARSSQPSARRGRSGSVLSRPVSRAGSVGAGSNEARPPTASPAAVTAGSSSTAAAPAAAPVSPALKTPYASLVASSWARRTAEAMPKFATAGKEDELRIASLAR